MISVRCYHDDVAPSTIIPEKKNLEVALLLHNPFMAMVQEKQGLSQDRKK